MISAPPFYRDEFGIGQARVARVKLAVYGESAAKEAATVICTDAIIDTARDSSARILAGHLAHYRRAQSVLSAMGEAL